MLIPNPLIAYGIEGAGRRAPARLLFAERVRARNVDVTSIGFRVEANDLIVGREGGETEHVDPSSSPTSSPSGMSMVG